VALRSIGKAQVALRSIGKAQVAQEKKSPLVGARPG
jgi:hypothetical protein